MKKPSRNRQLIKILTAAGLVALWGSAVPCYGAENPVRAGGWKQQYEIIQSITNTEKMEEGKPAKPGDMNIVLPEDKVVIDGSDAADSTVIYDKDGNVIGTADGENLNDQLMGFGSAVMTPLSSTRVDKDDSGGPGAAAEPLKIEDSTEEAGPQVKDSTLSEVYYEEYELYSESLENQFFIYANVGNNGITDKAVYLDIPQNITYTAEKDGAPFSYYSKQKLSETGTYVFRFKAVKDPTKPLSEQVIYKTTFNFRIQPKPEKPVNDELKRGAESLAAWENETENPDYLPPEETSDAEVMETEEESQSSAPEAGQESEGIPEESVGADDSGNADVPKDQEDTDAGEEYRQIYEKETGMYQIQLPQSKYFRTSVPNGMIWNHEVAMDFSGMGADADKITVLKDGENYAIPEGQRFSEVGSYTFLIPSEAGRSVYSFQLLGAAQSDLDSYTVPEGMTVTSLSRDGETIETDGTYGAERIDFTADGSYELTMENHEGIAYDVEVAIDHEAPKFSITVSDHVAMISYESADIRSVEVITGDETKTYNSLYEISVPGDYTVKVYDYAGNVSVKNVTVTKKFNLAGLAAILMIAALITAGVIFLRKTKRNFNVK